MIRICLFTIGILALLVPAAAADDLFNAAVALHEACTNAAAIKLANKKDYLYRLAYEALRACQAEQDEIATLATPAELQQVLGNTVYLRMRTIIEARAGPRTEPLLCASCGMRPTQDPNTRVWRLYRQ